MSFLQGQFTNDLRASSGAVYGLWLNVKGKIVGDSFVITMPGAVEYLVISYETPAAVLRERLESHIIADDVEVIDETENSVGITVIGAEADSWARELQTRFSGWTFHGRRGRMPHSELVFHGAPPNAADLATTDGFLGPSEMERRRIAARIPAIPRDLGISDLPNEGALDVDAVSYTKGCYLGQEVMARLKNLGQVRRRLLGVSGGAIDLPALPAPLFVGERQVGELRSAVVASGRVEGLAMLGLLHVHQGTDLSFTPGGARALSVADTP